MATSPYQGSAGATASAGPTDLAFDLPGDLGTVSTARYAPANVGVSAEGRVYGVGQTVVEPLYEGHGADAPMAKPPVPYAGGAVLDLPLDGLLG